MVKLIKLHIRTQFQKILDRHTKNEEETMLNPKSRTQTQRHAESSKCFSVKIIQLNQN